MRRGWVNYIFILVMLFIATLVSCSDADSTAVRKPVWAGRFYPGTASALSVAIDQYTSRAQEAKIEIPTGKTLKAIILPHAGYVYSGYTAAYASHVIKPGLFEKVILMGPDHRVGLQNGAISDVFAYGTPLGKVALHSDAEKLRIKSNYFKASGASDRSEHSLEVIIPFLQKYLNEFKLVPIVVGNGPVTKMAEDIQAIVDNQTLLVVSSDLSHFLPYQQAVDTDKKTIALIMDIEISQLLGKKNSACGVRPIAIALTLVQKNNWQPVLLNYTNSGDTAGSKDKVVGYAAIAFFGEENMGNLKASQKLSNDQGEKLCQLARATIEQKFDKGPSASELKVLEQELADKVFDEKRGVFVTLHISGQLRGCIGSLSGDESIRNGVKKNALNAAFNDYRFRPLSEEELEKIDLEVSILSEPELLDYHDSDNLVAQLRPGIDGVILGIGRQYATFLPQVWEQLPNPEDFLARLCSKAGLSPDAWRKNTLEVKTYQVQYFEEAK